MGKALDLRRRGLVVAALAGGGVLAVTLVQDVLLSVGSIVASFAYGGASFGEYVGVLIGGALMRSLTTTLPFGVGVFLALWQLAPVAPPLKFFHVVARSLLAAGVGAVAAFAVSVVVGIVSGLGQVAGLTFVGASFPVGETLGAMGFAFATGFQQALGVFVTQVPLVVLAGLVVWLWARGRDRAVDLEGALDL